MPPEHGNVREVRGSEVHLLVIGCKLAGPTVKGHDTADDERAQLRRLLTSELVGLGHLRIFVKTALWGHVIQQVWWPIHWRISVWVWLCRGSPYKGIGAPTPGGYHWPMNWGGVAGGATGGAG